jgi:hypothetical protein
VTKKLVKLVMEDTCKVLLDYNPKSKSEFTDTGLWKLIHKGKYVEDAQVPPGFNLLCEGIKVKPSNEI